MLMQCILWQTMSKQICYQAILMVGLQRDRVAPLEIARTLLLLKFTIPMHSCIRHSHAGVKVVKVVKPQAELPRKGSIKNRP